MNVLRTQKKKKKPNNSDLYISNISEDSLQVIYVEIKVSKRFFPLSQFYANGKRTI